MLPRGQRPNFPLLLCRMLSMLYHQVFVRHILREEEDGVGEVWMWDLHLLHLFKVCLVFVSICPVALIFFFSRSNDYSTNLAFSTWKALLLAYVVVGKAAKYTTDQPSLTKPPVGFHSVQSTSLSPSASLVTVFRSSVNPVLQAL